MSDSALSEYLASEAVRLTDGYARLPIPIGRVSYEQGMIIERKSNIGAFKAYMTLPKQPNDWAKVTLPSRQFTASSQVSPYDRFCIAHELAHLLIFRKTSFIPSDKRMYWKHEAICDEFARTILLPARFIDHLMAYDRLSMIDALCVSANVSWMVAAKRAAFQNHQLSFFIVKESTSAKSILLIYSSSLRNNKLRGSHLIGLLEIKIRKFLASDRSSDVWTLNGATIIQSNIIYARSDEEYRVFIKKDKIYRNQSYLAIEEIDRGSLKQ